MRGRDRWLQANPAVFVVLLLFVLIIALVARADIPTLEEPIHMLLTVLVMLLLLYLLGRGR